MNVYLATSDKNESRQALGHNRTTRRKSGEQTISTNDNRSAKQARIKQLCLVWFCNQSLVGTTWEPRMMTRLASLWAAPINPHLNIARKLKNSWEIYCIKTCWGSGKAQSVRRGPAQRSLEGAYCGNPYQVDPLWLVNSGKRSRCASTSLLCEA